ncbi:MAG: hypothetical protein H6719_33960 [Sandaracinaceae bacterium]|nr:hypothetical protein [Sandaracinaceae bacterium]
MADLLVLWHRWLPRRAGEQREPVEVASWRRMVAARLAVGGGEVVAQIGAAVVVTFDAAECVDALEIALDLLDEAENEGVDVAIGAAVGFVHDHEDGPLGAAFERAQQLANRARAGELVLDARAREAAREQFLFGRQVAGAWRGTTIDRDNPRRFESADAIMELAPATFPPIGASVVAEISMHLDMGTSRTFVLRGPVGAGAGELVGVLAAERDAPEIFEIGAAPGGLVPLASLRLALQRRYGGPEDVARAVLKRGAGPTAADALAGVAAGELVECDALALAVAALLAPSEQPAWALLSPLSLVDAATVAVLLRAREFADFVLFGRLPTEAALPTPFVLLDERVIEHVIPALKTADARIVAEEILGQETDPDVARKVAVLGGDTVIGVVEAARTLIATGEVVRGEVEGFVWRAGPRSGVDMISTEELISERIDLLDADARQVLEALCVAPDGGSRELLESVAARDAIGPATFDVSLERLIKEAFARDDARPRPTSSLLRWRVLGLTPAARAMELHRFFGEALAAQPHEHVPQLVELGYYLCEGGRDDEGRPLLTAVVEDLLEAGYRRAARHLSGWISEAETESAEGGATRATPLPPPAEAHDEGPPSNEMALGELLDEMAEEPIAEKPAPELPPLEEVAEAPAAAPIPAKLPPPPPPPGRRMPPPTPPKAGPPKDEEMLELSVDEVDLIDEPMDDLLDELELDMDGLSSGPDRRLALELAEDQTAEHQPPPHRPHPPEVDEVELFARDEPSVSSSAPPSSVPAAAPLAAEPDSLSIFEEDEGDDEDDDGAWVDADQLAPPDEPEQEPDSDETMLSDAAELMAAFRSHAIAATPPEPPPEPPAPSTVEQSTPTMELEGGTGETNVGPAPARSFVDEATHLIRSGAFDELDRAMERAVAEGGDLGAIGRVRAIAQLARGDVARAKASLDDARTRGRDDRAARGRYELAMALLSLKTGDAVEGVRRGLSALACSRELVDPRGEAAARAMLAACYRALGQAEVAERLEHA